MTHTHTERERETDTNTYTHIHIHALLQHNPTINPRRATVWELLIRFRTGTFEYMQFHTAHPRTRARARAHTHTHLGRVVSIRVE